MSNELKKELKSLFAAKGLTLTDVVNKMNVLLPETEQTTLSSLSNKLARGSLKYSEAKLIAKAIDMELRWVDQDG